MRFLLLVLLLSSPVYAQGNPENWCRGGAFPSESQDYRLATVKRIVNRSYFYGDDDNCPKGSEVKCRRKAYLIGGDRVVVSKLWDRWACSWYKNSKGIDTVGWLLTDDLEFTKPVTAENWVGNWSYADQWLDIKRSGSGYEVEGQAYWGSNANIHVGEAKGSLKINGNTATYNDDPCQIKMILVGDYLVVSDNMECGGANVTFSGVYRKK